jgi:hypothetical protein
MKKFLFTLTLSLIFLNSEVKPQGGVVNDGATIVIAASTSMVLTGGTTTANYINQTNGSDGSITIDGNLYLEGDWSNNASGGGKVFNSPGTNGTVYMNRSGAQSIGGTAATDFENLNLQNNTKTLNVTNVTVAGTLTLNSAIFDLNSKALHLKNKASGSLSGAFSSTQHIKSETNNGNSRLRWYIQDDASSAFAVPFATAAATDMTITLTVTTGGTESGAGTGYIEFFSYATADDNTPNPASVTHIGGRASETMDRYWSIASSGYTTAPTSTLRIKYDTGDLTGNTITSETNLQIQRWNSASGGYWETGGGSSTPASDYVERTGVNSYGVMVLSHSNAPLPIVLESFFANCINANKETEINWTTASEINNNYFTIEKSLDGIYYSKLAEVPSENGNSVIPQDYSYIDEFPYNGSNYYRLKQTDNNGSSETFDPFVIDCEYDIDESTIYNVFYDSDSENISFTINSASENLSSYYVSCYDVKGQKLLQEELILNKGQNTVYIQTQNLGKGIYFISFMNESYSGAQKLIVN